MPKSTSRRAVLAGVSAAPVLAVPAIAAIPVTIEPDPIFAVIAKCQGKIEECVAAFEGAAGLETDLVAKLQARGIIDNAVWAAGRHPRYRAACKAADRSYERADEAAMALLKVAPTTVAGTAAVLALAADVAEAKDWQWPDDKDGVPWLEALSRHVANALAEIAKSETAIAGRST